MSKTMLMFFRKAWLPLLLIFSLCAHAQLITRPIELSEAANRSFTNLNTADNKDGWIGEGASDMNVLPAGLVKLGNVDFNILADKETGGKSCIVLGSKKLAFLAKEAVLEFDTPLQGPVLYLLHASAKENARNTLAGTVRITFSDGSKQNKNIRVGRDVQPWTASRGAGNAARCWSEYNGVTQASLFVAKIPLTKKEVKSISFSEGDAVWMIAAASLGPDLHLAPMQPDFVMKGSYSGPAQFSAEELASVSTSGTPKNIVFIIGDGMGLGSLTLGSLHAHGQPYALAMQSLPVSGLCTTHSGSSPVTDSAASGTALSSGYKTRNGTVGMDLARVPRRTIAEQAQAAGKAVGLMTTDAQTGATPSAFVAHVPSRGMAAEIADWYQKNAFDLFIANGNKAPFLPESEKGIRKDGRNLLKELSASGYASISGLDDFRQVTPAKPVYGFMGWPTVELLGEMTELVLPYMEARSPKGFFIMIECSWPDSGGHGNNPDTSARGALSTDYTVRAAVEYALQKKDTLVIVTADHETGLLFAADNLQDKSKPHVVYQTTSHSQSPVPVFAFGPGSEKFHGVLDNVDIPTRFAEFWGLKLGVEIEQ